jgi:hypothetical protein
MFASSGSSATDTTLHMPTTTVDGRKSGTLTYHKSTAVSPTETVSTTDGPSHEADAQADDDATTTGVSTGAWPTPNCSTGNWSDFTGGKINANVISTGNACSSVQYSDGFPYSSSSVGITNGFTMTNSVPAGGSLSAFTVNDYAMTATSTATSTVDVNGSGGQPSSLVSTSSLGLSQTGLLGFSVGSFAAGSGSVIFQPATFTATANAGPSAAAPSTSGVFNFQLYDPNSALTICASRSGSYCNVSVNANSSGYSGSSISATVTLSVNVLLVEVARLTITTTITVSPPVKTENSSGTNVTYEKVVFPLPRISSALNVQSPIGTTLANISDDADFGELVAVASYQP